MFNHYYGHPVTEHYIIRSKFGYWNADQNDWVESLYVATWYCSEPFADGQADVLRERFCTKTCLIKEYA